MERLMFEQGHYRWHAFASDEELAERKRETLHAIMATDPHDPKRKQLLKDLVELRTEEDYRLDPYDLNDQRDDFDGVPFPLNDMSMMVRSIHEGICPTCGRQFVRMEHEDVGSRWDWTSMTGYCVQGHEHVAEPNEIDSDWVAW